MSLWPWCRRTKKAEADLRDAEAELERVRDQWPAVIEAAAELRAHHRRNHFAASIEAIYTGRRA